MMVYIMGHTILHGRVSHTKSMPTIFTINKVVISKGIRLGFVQGCIFVAPSSNEGVVLHPIMPYLVT